MIDEPKKKPGRLAQVVTGVKIAAVIAGSASAAPAPTQGGNDAVVSPAPAPVVASTEAKEYADMQKVDGKDRSRRAAELGYALRKPEQEIIRPKDPAPQRRGRR